MELWLTVAASAVIATIYGLSLWYRAREYRKLRQAWEDIVARSLNACPVCHMVGQHKLQCPNRRRNHGQG